MYITKINGFRQRSRTDRTGPVRRFQAVEERSSLETQLRQRKREGEWLKKGRESERGWKKRERKQEEGRK